MERPQDRGFGDPDVLDRDSGVISGHVQGPA
jgi:hypothetical protein